MRKLHIAVGLVLYGSFIASCNSSEVKKEPSISDSSGISNTVSDTTKIDRADCNTLGNFLISPDEADMMIKHFRKTFKKGGLTKSFWIDSCTILSLKRFFDNNEGFDGVRIHLGANAINTEILITVTRKIDLTNHEDRWNNPVQLPSICVPDYINVRAERRIRQLARFREKYREESGGIAKNDSLSRAVWFSSCVIDSLSKYLQNPSYGLDGVNIYSAAYHRDLNDPIQPKKANRSSFVIVVTKPDDLGRHKDDWKILGEIFAKYNKNAFNGGYNHGQLCPDICDED